MKNETGSWLKITSEQYTLYKRVYLQYLWRKPISLKQYLSPPLSLLLLWISHSEKSSPCSFCYLVVLWVAEVPRFKCQKLVSDETPVFLALKYFTSLSLITSHFRWIWNNFTCKWDWSFLVLWVVKLKHGGVSCLHFFLFLNSRRLCMLIQGQVFLFLREPDLFSCVLWPRCVNLDSSWTSPKCNSSKEQAWRWETPGKRECQTWYSLLTLLGKELKAHVLLIRISV